jgi:hypothetical protein
VVSCPRPYIYGVRSLIGSSSSEPKLVHAQCLKLYSDSSLNVTDALRTNIGLQGLPYEIDTIIGHRLHNGSVEFHVRWLGFDDAENTWEPFASLFRDAAATVRAYVADLSAADSAMLSAAEPQLR